MGQGKWTFTKQLGLLLENEGSPFDSILDYFVQKYLNSFHFGSLTVQSLYK